MQRFVKALPLTALNDALRAGMMDGTGLPRLDARGGVAGSGAVRFVVALTIVRWR